ncbi:hypothetical protein ES319_D01G119000v1 [Gossypium barbadense]|uniref:Uncharacterized protein n=1 Tax=Gossypium barbadense TaxID=3634 RepID=A0A5J5STB3_GOSBA|nr:hypothetical protein ES319_D01G119000v1 [Gossypium barbadense]
MRRSVRRAFERFLNLAYAPMTTERARISSPGTGTETRDVARRVRRQRLAWSDSEAWLVGPRESPGGCGAGGILETLGVSENYSNRVIVYWAWGFGYGLGQ